MSFPRKFRPLSRWLILLVGFAAVLVTTASFVPHDESNSDDLDCLVCKASNQPLTELSLSLIVDPPIALGSSIPAYRVELSRAVVLDAGSPRAPPA